MGNITKITRSMEGRLLSWEANNRVFVVERDTMQLPLRVVLRDKNYTNGLARFTYNNGALSSFDNPGRIPEVFFLELYKEAAQQFSAGDIDAEAVALLATTQAAHGVAISNLNTDKASVASVEAVAQVAEGAEEDAADALAAANGVSAALSGHIAEFAENSREQIESTIQPGNNISIVATGAGAGRVLTISSSGGGGGGGGTPETGEALAGSTVLAWPAMENRYFVVNSPGPATLTLPNDAGIPLGTPVRGVSIGAGLVSFASAGAINANAILPADVDQWSPFELRRVAGGWVRIA
jgi:hypothetical protein